MPETIKQDAGEAVSTSLNINISAYRVLYILLLLSRYKALNAVELNRFLYENPYINRVYNTETLTKYINTLREVGCAIPRSSVSNEYAYELRKNPFPLLLEPGEITGFSELINHVRLNADALDDEWPFFQEKLDWLLSDEQARQLARTCQSADETVTAGQREELLKQYRRYCRDMFTLEIRYPLHTPAQTGIEDDRRLVEPHEVLERQGRILLMGADRQTQEICLLDIEKILSVAQLPIKNRRGGVKTTVTFSLSGRLSHGYRPYPGETVVYRGKEAIHVKTKMLDTHALMNRLMKYGPACQVLYPATLRSEMRERIANRLLVLRSS